MQEKIEDSHFIFYAELCYRWYLFKFIFNSPLFCPRKQSVHHLFKGWNNKMKTKPKSESVAAGGGSGGNVYLLEINNQHTIMAVRRSGDDKSLFSCCLLLLLLPKWKSQLILLIYGSSSLRWLFSLANDNSIFNLWWIRNEKKNENFNIHKLYIIHTFCPMPCGLFAWKSLDVHSGAHWKLIQSSQFDRRVYKQWIACCYCYCYCCMLDNNINWNNSKQILSFFFVRLLKITIKWKNCIHGNSSRGFPN